MSQIRELQPQDIRAVADMFQRVFRHVKTPAPGSLCDYLQDVFLDHPWYDPDIGARVYCDGDDVLRGFIGVYPLHMTHNDVPIRAAMLGSLMVEQPHDHPLAGARLLRSVINGPQDLTLSETANAQSRMMWEKLRGRTLPSYGMDWARILRPAAFTTQTLIKPAWLAAGFRPLSAISDPLARWGLKRFIDIETELHITARDVGLDFIADNLPELAADLPLRPGWDNQNLPWFLNHAKTKRDIGPLISRGVYDRADRLIGIYLYHGRRSGIARVLQILALPGRHGAVITNLIDDADQRGCAGVIGKSHPHLLESLLRHRAILFRREATVAHSGKPELIAELEAGGGLIDGLAGERWSRLLGDQFE